MQLETDMPFLFSVLVTIEIALIITAVFSEIRKQVTANADAYVYSAIFVFSFFSSIIQLFFLLEIPQYFPIIDCALLIISMTLIIRNRSILTESMASTIEFIRANRIFSAAITFFPSILFVKGYLLPPTTWDSLTYHLARVMLMINDGKLFLENFADYRQDIMLIGYDCLHFLYLRFYSDFGLATFGFLSYSVFVSGLYTVTKKITRNDQIGKTICFLGAALPMFIVGAASTKNDIVLAAAVVACLTAAYGFSKTRQTIHLYFLIVSSTFGLSAKLTSGAFFLSFLSLYAVFIYYPIRLRLAKGIADARLLERGAALLLPIATIIFIMISSAHNYFKYGSLMGPAFYLEQLSAKNDFTGILINLLRYFIQAIDLPKELFGNPLSSLYELFFRGYGQVGVIFTRPQSIDLSGTLNPTDTTAWYGLLGLPILISIGYSLVKGDRFLRIVALSIAVSSLMIVVKIPWTPWNGRYFVITFGVGLVCLAFTLRQFSMRFARTAKWIVHGAVIISLLNLSYLSVYANIRDFRDHRNLFNNRDAAFYPKITSKSSWIYFTQQIPAHSRVLVVTGINVGILPLFLRRPDLDLTITGVYSKEYYRDTLKLGGKTYDLSKRNDFKAVQSMFDSMLLISVPPMYYKYYFSE